jgi:hypothetical protein
MLDGELHEGSVKFKTLYECEVARDKIFLDPRYKDIHPGLIYCDGKIITPNYSKKKSVQTIFPE